MDIALKEYGETLGVDMVKREFVLYGKDRREKQRLPVHSVKHISITSGNKVTTNSLFWASMYGIDILMLSDTGKPCSFIVPVDYQKNPKLRITQYKTKKGFKIAKSIIKKKLGNQLDFLRFYGYPTAILESCLQRLEHAETIRDILIVEAKGSSDFFPYYFQHIGTNTPIREKSGAVDPVNNLLNLGYELLKAEVLKGIYRSHLDPYYGFLHSPMYSRPSLAYDLIEPYRIFVEIFVTVLVNKNTRFENHSGRQFLDRKTKLDFIVEFNRFLDRKLILSKKFQNTQERVSLRALIKDESSRLSIYLRCEKQSYKPLKYLDSIDFQNTKENIGKLRYVHADWSKEELKTLRKYHSKETYKEIGKRIGKSERGVETMAYKLNLSKKYRKWTKKEERFLKENLGKMSIHEIAKRLNRPKSGVHYRISRTG